MCRDSNYNLLCVVDVNPKLYYNAPSTLTIDMMLIICFAMHIHLSVLYFSSPARTVMVDAKHIKMAWKMEAEYSRTPKQNEGCCTVALLPAASKLP